MSPHLDGCVMTLVAFCVILTALVLPLSMWMLKKVDPKQKDLIGSVTDT